MFPRAVTVVALLGSLVWLASATAQAQTDQQRVMLIMSKLPSPQSATYRALKGLADNPQVQVLALTKSEIWSVPAEQADAVVQAATRHGVSARPLREQTVDATTKRRRTRGPIAEASREPTDDWSRIFHLAPADIKITDKQKQLMEIARASHSTADVSVLQAPIAPVVEYALTKDAGSQSPSRDSAKITVALSQSAVLTINRTSVDVRPSLCIWHGTVEGTDEPATIIWWPDGKMAGSVQHKDRLYSLRHLGAHLHAMVEMADEKMPQEHAPTPARLRANDASLRDDPLFTQGDASILRPTNGAVPGKRSQVPGTQKDGRIAAVVPKVKDALGKPLPGKPVMQPKDVVIDVLVAYTKKTASNYMDVRRDLVDLAIEEGNQSFRQSGIGHVKLRLVHAYQTDYLEEGATHFDHVWRFADKGDGYMDEVHELRNKYKADVGILIVDDPKGCGLATRVYADAEEAFAVVHHECAAATYSMAHEIGHLIGARHDLNLDKSMTPFPYGHGYVNGTKWRDIMSYKESCNGCPRLPVWSNPTIQVKGEPAGTPDLDNARVIAEQAGRVAGFR